MISSHRPFAFRATFFVACSVLMAGVATAATPPSRLRADARLTDRAELPQAVSARVAVSQALGSVRSDTALESMSLVLAPSAAQTAALNQLLADQQNAASARYHQWLTPAQFGAQFGVSDADLAILENWLTSQGLQVQGVPASRNAIYFSGTAATVEAAFHPSLQRFERNGQKFVSNTAVPTMPAAFAGVVGGVRGLSTYHPQPHARLHELSAARPHPDYTGTNSAGNTIHELVPYDVRQIYSASSLVSSGYTGSGVTIAVIGQTAVSTTQLGYFQSLTGQTVVAPTLTLVPGTGTSTLKAGDEFEAESDIEYASGVAPGASVNFVYTGSSTNADVFTALEYAITNNIGSIVTLSYGGCEILSASDAATLEPYLRQASAQGQTFLNSSGDSGAAGCDSGLPTAYYGLSASYPATSPNTTAVGGTTLTEGTGTYWAATNNSQNGSALGYIPEVVWNDSDSKGISASGGGGSVLFSKPAWQTGTGVPADKVRDVPDVSFAAGADHDPYILCSADTSATYTTSTGAVRTAACTATAGGYYAVGGTSLSSPSFAGLLALVEQANGGKRLGNINPTLYALAASTPAVFNDIVNGTTALPCVAGSPGCINGSIGYAATTGYDRATGLGSVNISTFSGAITAAATVAARTPTVTVEQLTNTTSTDSFRVSVIPVTTATTLPTGTVTYSLDGGATSVLTLASSTATFSLTVSSLSAGTHTVTAVYSGDSNYPAATTSFSFVTGNLVGTFALTVNPTTLSVATGSSGTATVSLTSTGYTGIVLYTFTPASGSATAPGCFTGASGDYTDSSSNVGLSDSVTAGSTVSAAIKYHAVTTGCSTLSQLAMPGAGSGVFTASNAASGRHLPWAAFALGGFLLGGLTLRRRNTPLLSGGLFAVAFSIAVLGASGCGSGTSPLNTTTTTTTTTTAAKTYTYVVTAISYPSGGSTGIATTTASANLTLTVQ